MNFLRTLKLAFKSLLLHPLRSALAVLGIFIGVASVIWLLAIGEGIGRKAQEQIANLGAENVLVRTVKPANEAFGDMASGPVVYGLTRADYVKMVATIPSIKQAIPVRELRRNFRFGKYSVDGRMVGCTPAYADVTRLEVDRGRFLSDTDVRQEMKHCVLSAEVAQRLFPIGNPVGEVVMLEDDFYTIVGVMKPRNATAAIGGSLDSQSFADDVYVPITTVWRRIGDLIVTMRPGSFEGEVVELNQITLRIDHTDNVLKTVDVVRNTLAEKHSMPDFAVVAPLELLEQSRTTRLMFMVLLGLIAAISLLVGGIGIMNIMLATVTERTREIGIRRALGARRSDIISQFLAETIALSVAGGLLGVGGGAACGLTIRLIRKVLDTTMPDAMERVPEIVRTMEPVHVPWAIPLAFGISVGVGVVFGLYPAMRAADMDPIEALRHE